MRRTVIIAMLFSTSMILGTAGVLLRPHWKRKQIEHNKAVIVHFLKDLSSVQAHLHSLGLHDRDDDGQGEYGFLGQLSAGLAQQGHPGWPMSLNVGDKEGGPVGQGIYQLHGYYIRVYLPGSNGAPCCETDPGDPGGPGGVDAELAARYWWCLAWPVRYGVTGDYAYYTNQAGDTFRSVNHETRYEGLDRMPPPDAGSDPDDGEHQPWQSAGGGVARDGYRWTVH